MLILEIIKIIGIILGILVALVGITLGIPKLYKLFKPKKKGEISLSYLSSDSKKEYKRRVVCLNCQEDWDYLDEIECIYCGSDKIAEYSTHKIIKELSNSSNHR